ncbi:SDR family oxidoreductase [Candidatus Chlorohelix sp.]|uniref:SDR family oxidoreductase n=1 Tax=Candidatus Chlorohelix sp. TaxID=3139201 RepID=UPI0030414F86
MLRSIFRERLFDGHVIMISGGGSGIGRAIARELAVLGATVVICGRTLEKLEAVKAEIEAEGGKVHSIVCNIRDEEQVKQLFAQILEKCGRIDALVNNAGGQFLSPAEAITAKGWNAVIETNLTGAFFMCKAAQQVWMKEHGGAIVTIVADIWRGFPNMAHSGAARAGVVNLTQTLALEWAQYAIRINAVAPGLIDSSGLSKYPPEVQAMLAQLPRDIPAQRMGTEREVAAAVVFLLSPAAAFISGETLKVDGAGSLYRLQGYVIPEHTAWESYGEDS